MSSFVPVKTAVFPVAGLGTRFLPATKEIPKEMLPLIDKPLIHHGVTEATESGCQNIVFITGKTRDTSIRKYFRHSPSFVNHLKSCGKTDLACMIDSIHKIARFKYAVQEQPLGLGHAVLCAEEFCSDPYFALLLPDDVMPASPTVITQLEDVRKEYGGSVIALEEVAKEDTSRYGIISGEEVKPGVYRIRGLVEKPNPSDAPSCFAIMGRYVLSSSIFKHLKTITPGSGREYQLTDAIASMLDEEPVYGCVYKGRRLDCGIREGWLRANIVMALENPELRQIVIDTLKEEGII